MHRTYCKMCGIAMTLADRWKAWLESGPRIVSDIDALIDETIKHLEAEDGEGQQTEAAGCERCGNDRELGQNIWREETRRGLFKGFFD